MDNQNPIYVDKTATETTYEIPADHKDSEITITVLIDLVASGWVYSPRHTIFLGSKNIFPASTPDPSDLSLGESVSLDKKVLKLDSRISLIKEAGGHTGPVPQFTYILLIHANGKALDTFSRKSTGGNPTYLHTKLIFKQL